MLFNAASQGIPEGAVIIEIGPHSILRSPLRQCRPDLPYVSLMKKGDCGLATLSAGLEDMWRHGVPVRWQADAVVEGAPGTERESSFCSCPAVSAVPWTVLMHDVCPCDVHATLPAQLAKAERALMSFPP